ncbi:cysteine-rich receptor-like protein kinase 10 isoform X2 [Tasmannia lanceolata]|uniref:cysteine-rich receptor-like protein kinase 10 isoform X2 n=1 Tax=Tasmannia lanceolata TaxID=3420 RepID=UPI0040642DB7
MGFLLSLFEMIYLSLPKLIDLLSFTLLLFLLQSPVEAEIPIFTLCQGSTNYSTGSQFETNLKALLPSLQGNNAQNLNTFYNTTSGQDPNRVYGYSQCMSGASAQDCEACLKNASVEIIQLCPNRTQAVVRYYNCILRYSNQQFFSQLNSGIQRPICRAQEASDPVLFNGRLGDLMSNLTLSASSNPLKIAIGDTKVGDFTRVYGLGQCTRDLSQGDCQSCLETMIGDIPTGCANLTGGNFYSVSCTIRYETYPFFDASPPPPGTVAVPPLPPSEPSGKKSGSKTVLIIIIVVVSMLVLISIICAWLWKRKTVKQTNNVGFQEEISCSESLLFGLATLKAATDNFSGPNKLGEGGFGPVYKGLLKDGREIAVKRLSGRSTQGIEELRNEIILLVAKLQHKNLVRLLGFCLEDHEKMLVYEYLPNTSLDTFLFDPAKQVLLDWERRYKIIEGIARGLLYLHEDSQLKIIHRDLKASNILMDGDMNPKISDFGLAKLFGGDETHGCTNRIAGTYGYMSPEYVMHGQFSTKSDVFSFGVLVLEIITGRKNAGFQESDGATNLLSYTWRHWREETVLDIVDRTLGEQYRRDEVFRCIHMGLLCVQEDATERPTMSSVVLMLNSNSITLTDPFTPAFCVETRMMSNMLSSVTASESEKSGSLTASESEQSGLLIRPRGDRRTL